MSLSSACNAGPSLSVSRVHTEGRLFWSDWGSPFIVFLLLASLADMRSPAIAITAAGIVDDMNHFVQGSGIEHKSDETNSPRPQLYKTEEFSTVVVEQKDDCIRVPCK
jgi:hypothetical protein